MTTEQGLEVCSHQPRKAQAAGEAEGASPGAFKEALHYPVPALIQISVPRLCAVYPWASMSTSLSPRLFFPAYR